MKIGTGIAIAGIWLGTGLGLIFGADPGIVIGSTIASVFCAIFN